MAETKSDRVEREYVIPLREKCRPVPRYKKANKAVKSIKEFLARHMQIRDRDLSKIKLERSLNEAIWQRGIRSPPHKIKVKAIKEKDIVRVELVDYPAKIKFRKLREEKREKAGKEVAESKKSILEKAKEAREKKPEESKEEKEEQKEKAKAVEEAGLQLEKSAAKQIKHQAGGKTKEPKRPVRQALQK
jgi:large subunit ribosomal protein L31e